ncbi:unnamed protein product [Phaedon cochleariae]|uniref:Uncharacterized protein n=1 Tax=Phaedon cochleariae TaxID=80249 RepID=A0A9N9X4X6_PHACE|nr:unnamed protein product [Phaedon cochleariae]
MEEIYFLIENSEECQLSFEQLRSAVSGVVPSNDTIKSKLRDKYADRIIIAVGVGWRDATICFNDVGFKILKSWYDDKKADESDERVRIVQAAAKIIRQDVQKNVYDTTVYPPGNNFLKEAASCVPPTLRVFLETLIMKKADNVNKQRKCISIAHSIISAIRPTSFVSSIMNSVALFVYRRFASKKLVNLLSSLGFSASYHSAQQLEMSAINHIQPDTDTSFLQFVFDNADFNVRTLDGLNTFHSMGGIKSVPSESTTGSEHEKPIPRLTKVPPAETVGELGVIPLRTYQKSQGGLRNVIVEDLTNIVKKTDQLTAFDTLWLAAKWLNIKCVPEWKGFMHSITKGLGSKKTEVIPIPFINSPPSDENTIHTALQYAGSLCEKANQKHTIVTFDQPLYMKAREIVAAAGPDSLLSKCIVRLGGFHLLMSYIGCIGYLMNGSGLQDLMCTIYAPISVEKMLQGKAFARAVRALLLIHRALANMILEHIDVNQEELEVIKHFTENMLDESPSLCELQQNVQLLSLTEKLQTQLTKLKENGPTATLWVQLFSI